MSKLARKKPVPRKAKKEKPLRPAKDQKQESEDIERAVYDGMQDLRVKKYE
jgi:hypothetical protein